MNLGKMRALRSLLLCADKQQVEKNLVTYNAFLGACRWDWISAATDFAWFRPPKLVIQLPTLGNLLAPQSIGKMYLEALPILSYDASILYWKGLTKLIFTPESTIGFLPILSDFREAQVLGCPPRSECLAVEEVARDIFCPRGFNLLQKEILPEMIDSSIKNCDSMGCQWGYTGTYIYIYISSIK